VRQPASGSSDAYCSIAVPRIVMLRVVAVHRALFRNDATDWQNVDLRETREELLYRYKNVPVRQGNVTKLFC